MPSTQIPVDKRYECYKDVKSGYTIREASRKYGISTFGVRFNVKRVDETGSLRNRTYADRQILQSPATKFIDETLQSRPTTTKKELQQRLKEMGSLMSIRQIKFRLQLLGYRWKKIKKCQVISERNRLLRCEFHQWFVNTGYIFDHHIFIDESTVRLGKTKSFCYVKEGERVPVAGQLAHGISVHVWGGISWNGPTEVLVWDGRHRMDSSWYVKYVLPEIIKAGNRLFDGDYQLVQDSSSVHVSHESMNAFNEQNVNLFPWVAQSPDWTGIEFVWRDMKAYITTKTPKTKVQLVRAIHEFWNTITPSYCRTLIRLGSRNIERAYDGLNREKDQPTRKVYKN